MKKLAQKCMIICNVICNPVLSITVAPKVEMALSYLRSGLLMPVANLTSKSKNQKLWTRE
jgi:ABC-type transport system involved in cytochrome c biogenesis permease component